MAPSRTSKPGKAKVSTQKRDQIFDTVDAIQNGRQREALTHLKDILDPANDYETQRSIGKYSSVAVDSVGQGSLAHKSLQTCWRLPFRGLSHQIYAILREEFALTGSFDSVLHRLDVSLSEHPKQARKLAEERKVLRSKDTNDMRAWTRSSDDLLQQSFAKRAEAASSNEGHCTKPLQEAVHLTAALDAPQEDVENLGPVNSDSPRCYDMTSIDIEDGDAPLRDIGNHVSSIDTVASQHTFCFQDTIEDDSQEEPLHQNANRESSALASSGYSQLHTDTTERSLSAWKRGAGRKKSWKYCPVQKLPTRRKCKGYRESTSNFEDQSPSESAPSTEEFSTSGSTSGMKLARYTGHHQKLYINRDVRQSKRRGQKESEWTWKGPLSILDDYLNDLVPTGRWPLMHTYPMEQECNKIIIQRPTMSKHYSISHAFSWALPKWLIAELRPFSSAMQEFPKPVPMRMRDPPKKMFITEKMSFGSLLLSIPDNLPGSSPQKQKRRGVNKLKIPEFCNAAQLLSYLQASWSTLLRKMTELKNSLLRGWEGTQESYSRKRRTCKAWKKQLEDLEALYLVVQKMETRYNHDDMGIRQGMRTFDAYTTRLKQSQITLIDLPWRMRKQPGGIWPEPLPYPHSNSSLVRHGIMLYSEDQYLYHKYRNVAGHTRVLRLATSRYRSWRHVRQRLILGLLNGKKSAAT